ncbi:hypothetical protein B0T20DRAFT_44835 [Sordaria brevicollis]|uniref:Uncharacterized protein n=1 Tax=Sordaria brevicollis TaxID=83679 RepID=A0AAE0U9G8_SORBR|nr:hypothetical protein B0T20DRAFT_44835 [Sordaria brevicollis]
MASPSGINDPVNADWRNHDLVTPQLNFFQQALAIHPGLKSLRLDFVREMLPQSVWDDLVIGIAQLKSLSVLTLSHMRLPAEQHGSFHSDEVLETERHTGKFRTLILTDYGRCFETLDSLINWSQNLEHLTLMLRISPWLLDRAQINLNELSASIMLTEELRVLLSPHETTLRTLRLGATLTPHLFSVAVAICPKSPLHLHHNVIPDFRSFSRLEHLHLSLVFAGQQGSRKLWDSLHTDEARNKQLQEYDRLLPPSLVCLTFDIGDEFSMRHSPVFPEDLLQEPTCELECPYDRDAEIFLIKLAERAKMLKSQGKTKLCEIHVNFCMNPFALPMPKKDMPSGFNWKWNYDWDYFSPWKRLEKVKKSVEEHGILFTYECLEPHCGKSRMHIHPVPTLSDIDRMAPRNETPDQQAVRRARAVRDYNRSVFDYEDEMCSEHVWMRVFSDKSNPGIKNRSA